MYILTTTSPEPLPPSEATVAAHSLSSLQKRQNNLVSCPLDDSLSLSLFPIGAGNNTLHRKYTRKAFLLKLEEKGEGGRGGAIE